VPPLEGCDGGGREVITPPLGSVRPTGCPLSTAIDPGHPGRWYCSPQASPFSCVIAWSRAPAS